VSQQYSAYEGGANPAHEGDDASAVTCRVPKVHITVVLSVTTVTKPTPAGNAVGGAIVALDPRLGTGE